MVLRSISGPRRLLAGSLVGTAGALALVAGWNVTHRKTDAGTTALSTRPALVKSLDRATLWTVELDDVQRDAIGLRTAKVERGPRYETLQAPGRIAPNENRYAFITPRASGIARVVAGRIGQDVKAGDILVTIDSAEVAQARSDLLTRLQELELAKLQADWRVKMHESTVRLVERIKAGDTPEEIHERFQDEVLGPNREKLVGALAQLRLAKSTLERNKALVTGTQSVPFKQYQQSVAEHEAAQATYQALLDSIGYETKLAADIAVQQLRQSETAVRVARERLLVLGLAPDGSQAWSGQDKDNVRPDGPEGEGRGDDARAPLSTYALRAPFDGTILDRAAVVPGVAVDKEHQVFTMADLSTVWVEVQVYENDFAKLPRSRDGRVLFTSPAYPGRTFEAKVIYTGDLVDDKTRSVLLLAQADNADRALKPGMFIEARITTTTEDQVPLAPRSALLTDDHSSFVFVKNERGAYERRDVQVDEHESIGQGPLLVIHDGLRDGDEVVVEGGFKLKSAALRRQAEQ